MADACLKLLSHRQLLGFESILNSVQHSLTHLIIGRAEPLYQRMTDMMNKHRMLKRVMAPDCSIHALFSEK
jgi:hypothetical protein